MLFLVVEKKGLVAFEVFEDGAQAFAGCGLRFVADPGSRPRSMKVSMFKTLPKIIGVRAC